MSLRECWSDTSICSASQCRTIFRHMERTLLDFYSAREVHCACIAKRTWLILARSLHVVICMFMSYVHMPTCMYVCIYIYIVLFHGAHDITAFHLKCWEPRKSPRTRTWSRPPSTKSINWQLSNSPNRPNGVDVLSPKFSMRRF